MQTSVAGIMGFFGLLGLCVISGCYTDNRLKMRNSDTVLSVSWEPKVKEFGDESR